MNTAEPPPAPQDMSDADLLAAWNAVPETEDGDLPSRAQAILDEIERRNLDI